MARNLQSKLSTADSIRLFDLNTAAVEKLAGEMRTQQAGGAAVEIFASAADAAKEAVGHLHFLFVWHCHYPEALMMRQTLPY